MKQNSKVIYFNSKEYQKIIRSSEKIIEKKINEKVSVKGSFVEISVETFHFKEHVNNLKSSNTSALKHSFKTKTSFVKNDSKIKNLISLIGECYE